MSKRTMLIIACTAFFGLGWLGSSIGPALEELADQNHTKLAIIGTISLIGLIGGFPAQGTAGMISDRYGVRFVLMAGMAFLGIGNLLFVNSHAVGLAFVLYIFVALGFGIVDVGYNILIAEVYAGQVSAMNMLHTFFGIGAVAGPAFAGLTLSVADTALPGIWLGALMMLALIPLVSRLPHDVGKPDPAATAAAEATSQPFTYRNSLLWVLGSIMLLYVGIELGTNNWTPAYLDRSTSLSKSAAALATSGFWLTLTGSRMLMALFGERFTPRRVMWVSATGSVIGGGLMAISTGSALFSIMGVLIAGFAFGPVYPTIMLIVTRTFRNGPGKAASIAAMMGGIGGGALPWVQGVLLGEVSPAASVIWVGTGAVIMLGLWVWVVPRLPQEKRKHVEPEPALVGD